MTPLEKYRNFLLREDFSSDPSQKDAVLHTQALYEELIAVEEQKGLVKQLKDRLLSESKQFTRGLYLWGGVGRGKTFIIDAFYDCLPFPEKLRIHFHRFMQKIHHELKQLKNVEDPLTIVADTIAKDTRVLCFDEFHVTDITDAMLLGGFLKAMFERGVVLVTTSNEAPEQLYSGGLQRERFLPAIELIKQHTHVINVDSGIDYRLRFLDKAETYHYPLDDRAEKMLRTNFEHIAPDEGSENYVLEIEGRPINTVYCADGVVWFEFSAICDGPRGAADYIELSRQFQTVLIANIPILTDEDIDQAKRLMTLVDEFYDHNVKLIITAATTPEKIYQGDRLSQPFQRTVSRLQEMQTHDYLARQHLS